MSYWKYATFRISAVLFFSLLAGCATLNEQYFKIHFIDEQTSRGIPLVEIETINAVRYFSDSAGWVAISQHDFASESLYFYVRSDGYELASDKYGFRGIRIKPIGGGSRTVALRRINIAERLYRITGEGIYHDSQLLGITPPIPSDPPPGGVFGQDSVFNAIYDDQLFWFWGDTRRGNNYLGNFKVSGAVSKLPQAGQDPAFENIALTYFVNSDGFVRPMCPFEGKGAIWINSPMVLEEDGQEYMLTHYSRMMSVENRIEHGIAAWNNVEKVFEKQVEFPLDATLYPRGNALKLEEDGETWFYLGSVFPDVRVRTSVKDILDPKRYQAYTCLSQGSRWQANAPPLDRDQNGQLVWSWKADTDRITKENWDILLDKDLVKTEEYPWQLVDTETGDRITPHRGAIAWNRHRNRWILIATQLYGSSLLGEVWYAEALNPMGPWSEARKIVTHARYSFYNVTQHPYFAFGPYIYFEGTYSNWLSGVTQATPRYNYNQIMYRLNLDDPRLPHLTERGTAVVKIPLAKRLQNRNPTPKKSVANAQNQRGQIQPASQPPISAD